VPLESEYTDEEKIFLELLDEKRHQQLIDAIRNISSVNNELINFVNANTQIIRELLRKEVEEEKNEEVEKELPIIKVEANNDVVIKSFEDVCDKLMRGLSELSNKIDRNKILSIEYSIEKDNYSGALTKVIATPKYNM